MQHLEPERLAALDHDPPTPSELAHLAACADCRTERDAYAALGQLAATAADVDSAPDAPRLVDWSALSAQLRSEGLLRTTGEHAANVEASPLVVRSLQGVDVSGKHRTPSVARVHAHAQTPARSHARTATPWMRLAAALLLVLGGAALGRLSMGEQLLGGAVATTNTAADAAPASFGEDRSFASVQEATRVLTTAQRDYERASLFLAANDTTVRSPDVFRARLAALDQMMAASRAALRDAPQDPVLNHYYLAAYTAREATLRQLVSTLPVDQTIEGF